MITMILLFLFTCILSFILWVWGKLEDMGMTCIVFAGVVLFILVPALSQKIPIVYDKIPYASTIHSEIYYSKTKNKYYKITDDEHWNIFDLYDIYEIGKDEANSYIN